MNSIFSRGRANGSSGIALIVTLMMMSVLVMMVVGLAGVMRNEQAAARNLTYQVLAEQLADIGARQAMGVVLSASLTNGTLAASGPGWIQAGTSRSNLFLTNTATGIKNLEEIGTNSLILGLADGVRGGLWSGWSNLVAPGGSLTRPIGRYTYWVDDEGTKVNLNLVAGDNTNFLVLATNFPVSGTFLFVDPSSGATNSASSSRGSALGRRTNAFFTTESLKDTNVTGLIRSNEAIGASVYRRTKGHVTAWSSNLDLTPWGTRKFSLSDLTNTVLYPSPSQARAAVKAVLTDTATNGLTNIFGAGMTLARKFGGGDVGSANPGNHGDLVMEQIAANICAAAGRPVLLTNAADYQAAFGNTDPRRQRNGLPRQLGSQIPGPYLEEVRTRVDFTANGNTMATRVAFLVRVVNPYNQTFSNYSLRVQPRKFRFHVLPSGARSTAANSSAPLNGFVGPIYGPPGDVWAGPEWYTTTVQPWPLTSFYTSNNLSFGPRSQSDHIFTTTITLTLDRPATTVPEAYVILDQVGLFASAIPAATSLRDWLSADDLAQAANFTSTETGQMNFNGGNNPMPVNGGGPLSGASFTAANSLGVRKIDPQVRFALPFWNTNGTNAGALRPGGWPATAQAWTRTLNLAQAMTNRGYLTYLTADPAPGVVQITNHPHFTPGFYVTNGIRSIAQLGAIHTGIPWRTLRLQPQLPQERLAAGGATNSPPDWVVLDLFTGTNATNFFSQINVNGLPVALQAQAPGLATNQNGSLPTRCWALLAALQPAASGLQNASVLASNGVPSSLANSGAPYPSLPRLGTNLTLVLSNPAMSTNWSTNSTWATSVRGSRAIFPAHGLLLRGELVEIAGLAEDPNNILGEDVIEGRLRCFLDLVTTRSDTFTVWSVGQGLTYNTNQATNPIIMGEVRKQTVFQRIPQLDPATGRLTNHQLRVLYTRNHVIE